MSTTSTYAVTGMTCSHCVAAVTEEISKIGGVNEVEVDLASGAVTVASQNPLDATSVKDAVEESGYELADA